VHCITFFTGLQFLQDFLFFSGFLQLLGKHISFGEHLGTVRIIKVAGLILFRRNESLSPNWVAIPLDLRSPEAITVLAEKQSAAANEPVTL